MNPKPITKWGLSRWALRKVKRNMTTWMEHFGKYSDIRFTGGKLKDINRCDFVKMDFFFFTDCRDILAKSPEMKGVEANLLVRARKRAKLMTMLMSSMMGNDLNKKIKCTHCGHPSKIIDGFEDGGGHFIFCPKCGMTSIFTYPPFYNTCLDSLKKGLLRNGYKIKDEDDETTPSK